MTEHGISLIWLMTAMLLSTCVTSIPRRTATRWTVESKNSPSLSSTQLFAKAAAEVFFCNECGTEHIKWVGRCSSCKEWNTVKPFRQAKLSSIAPATSFSVRNKLAAATAAAARGPSGDSTSSSSVPWFGTGAGMFQGTSAPLVPMESVELNKDVYRLHLFSDEMNRVLGGGLVRGSVTLLAGDPGIGKSTLLLQLASSIASNDRESRTVVYMSGEENQEQIAARAQRLGLSPKFIFLICDVDVDSAVDTVLAMPDGKPPALVIVDSIQTMRTGSSGSGMGSVSQIRESAARLVELAKTTGIAVLLIGHVTKSGDIAGPRVLEHMVDCVLQLEGSERAEYRLLRGVKNRFGSTAEIGVFVMTERGMEDCANPSALFMSPSVVSEGVEGCATAVVMEGTRPLLAEIQGLVGASMAGASGMAKVNPRRASDGFPIQRLLLLCAVIEKRLQLSLWSRDVYLNVVGGLRISEPASDLAVVVAVVSSLTGMKVRKATAFVGEIGLAGEVRGVRGVEARIAEAQKMGFTTVVVPSYGTNGGKQKGSSNRSTSSTSSSRSSSSTSSSGSSNNVDGGMGVVQCSSLVDVLTVALGAKDFQEIRGKLKKRFHSSTDRNRGQQQHDREADDEIDYDNYDGKEVAGWDDLSDEDAN